MRFRGLDLNLLVVLDALFETRSVTKAGKRLNLSQSATSSALSRLRSFFDDELLVAKKNVNGTKEMTATAFGNSLAAPVRSILAEIQATLNAPAAFDLSTCNEHIRILAPDFVEAMLLAEVVRRASELAPQMTFEISGAGSNDEAVTELDRNIADFLIVTHEHLAAGHPSIPILTDTSVCLGCASNRLLGKTLSQEEFLSLKRIELNKVHGDDAANIEKAELSLIRSKKPCLTIDHLSSIPFHVVGSEMVCIVPRILAVQCAEVWPLKFVAIAGFDVEIEFRLQWNKSSNLDPARAWFRDFVVQISQDLKQHA